VKTPIVLLAIIALLVATGAGSAEPRRAHEISPAGLGSKIAFTADRVGRDAPDEIYVMNGDGTDERRITVTESGNALFPDWSPNGKVIAFHNNPVEIGGPEIFLIDADGTGLNRLTHMTEQELGAVNASWSPNGKKIAFNSVLNPDIYVIDVDGTRLTRLTDHPASDTRPDWSPDGRKIAFNSNRDGNPEIYVMDADGTDPVRLTAAPGMDVGPEWSPDGRRITFESTRDGNREIYVTNADGTDQVRLTSNLIIDAFPSWSPDGRSIVFHRQLVQLPGLDPPNGSELFIVNADGSEEMQLTRRTPDSFSAFASWAQGHSSAP
jgi:tol-pal system beta propeller repeat protein TolB